MAFKAGNENAGRPVTRLRAHGANPGRAALARSNLAGMMPWSLKKNPIDHPIDGSMDRLRVMDLMIRLD